MAGSIRIHKPGSMEYKNLELAAVMMTKLSPRGYRYYVGDTFFDIGQNWMWTTILCDGGNFGGSQALYPGVHEEIVKGDIAEIEKAVLDIFNDKFYPDKQQT